MKLTKTQYEQFKQYIIEGLQARNITLLDVKNWVNDFNEKLSNTSCLTALRLAKTTDDGYFWVQSLNLNDSHWATAGRKYFKEFI